MQHGGDLTEAMARFGAGDPPWLDLSTGINPHPWPVPDGMRSAGWERLPSRHGLDRLLAAARSAYRVPERCDVVAAPGTQALIQWLPRLAPPGDVAILGPTYGEHAAAWRASGRTVWEVSDLAEAQAAPNRVLVRPNNPDGAVSARSAVEAAARACAERGGWLVVDESFVDLDPDESLVDAAAEGPIVVLRSFGKFYGLAGLRLGFAVARPATAALIAAAIGPWPVAGPALAVGSAALHDGDWAGPMRVRLAAEAAALDRVLGEAGLGLVGGTSLYRLVRHPAAHDLHAGLAERHIWCRVFPWARDLLRFGLPPDPGALRRLGIALGEVGAGSYDQGTTTA